jgi:hypothetical protein
VSRLPRRARLVLPFALVVLVLIGLLVVRAVNGGESTPVDASLQRTATAVLPDLENNNTDYEAEGSALRKFQRYVIDTRMALAKSASAHSPRNQFQQVLVTDVSLMPPQVLVVQSKKRDIILLNSNFLGDVLKEESGRFTTTRHKGQSYRAYAVPVTLPAGLRGQGLSAILEVFARR